MNDNFEKKGSNDNFGSRLGIIAATAGSAVGLGNLWGFSYKAGENGGGVFMMLYLLSVLFIGIPVIICEFIIGKNGRSDAVNSIKNLSEGKNGFASGGFLGIVSSFLILSFYGVIAGWAIIYFYEGILYGYGSYTAESSSLLFSKHIMSTNLGIVVQSIFMFLTVLVVSYGVQGGIEKISKVLMPLLFLIIFFLAIYGLTLDGAAEAYKFLFYPSMENVEGNIATVAMSAMSQAFFSLSIGMGAIITYSAYIKEEEDIISITKQVSVADTLVAVLAGLAIFPIVFTFGIDYSEGASLMFVSLPIGFNQMAGGRIIGILFFLLVFVAAITSSFSLLENVVSYTIGEFKLKRRTAAIIIGVIITILGLASQPGFEFGLSILDWTGSTQLLDQLDMFTMSVTIPLGALIIVLFTGYRLNPEIVYKEFKSRKQANAFLTYVKYVLPIFMISILSAGLLALILK